MTMSLIETVEVGAGGAASIEFTSIPQDGTDLVLLTSIRLEEAITHRLVEIQFNSDTGNNYPRLRLIGTGSSVLATNAGNDAVPSIAPGSSVTANTFSNGSMYVSNYTSTTDKSISLDNVTENNATEAYQYLVATKYETTNPITSILLQANNQEDLAQYSTASLYKITAA